MISNFLNLDNKKDFKKWEKVIENPCIEKLNKCPYEQDFKQSQSCSHYEQVNEGKECSFVWITDSKCYCELQLKQERK